MELYRVMPGNKITFDKEVSSRLRSIWQVAISNCCLSDYWAGQGRRESQGHRRGRESKVLQPIMGAWPITYSINKCTNTELVP